MKKFFSKISLLPFTPLVITPILLLSPVLFTKKALFWGTPSTQFVPWWQWSFDTLLSGSLPLWNPLVGMGAPLIANYQSALFYPPNWLYFGFYLVGGISALAWSQAFVVTLHLIASGLGMAFLARKLGLGTLAQTISGLAFSLSGYLVARAWFASINTAIAWLPWVLVFSYEIGIENKKVMSTLKLGAVVAIQLLTGHAQTSWYTWLLAGLWVVFWTRYSPKSEYLKNKPQILTVGLRLTNLSLAILLGVMLSAVQLFPTAAYLLQSQRAASTEYEIAMTYSFWPWRILGLIAPNLFGSPVSGNYWGYGNYWEDALYIGMTPLLLAVVVGFQSSRKYWVKKIRKKPDLVGSKGDKRTGISNPGSIDKRLDLSCFLLMIVLISFILALGSNTPVFPWLYHHIPTFDMFQSPTRFSIWMVFSLILLAGIGIDTWHRPTHRALYWTRLGTAGAFAVSLAAGIGGFLLKDIAAEFNPTFVPAFALAGFWGFGTGLLSLTAPRGVDAGKTRNHLWTWGVIVWVSIDLLVAGFGLNPGIDLTFYSDKVENSEDIQAKIGEGRLFFLTEDEYDLKYMKYFRFDSFDPGLDWYRLRETFLPNLNMIEDLPVINNYDPLVPGRYAKWMDGIEEINIHIRNDLLDRMGVSVLEWLTPSTDRGVRFVPREGATRVRWVPCARFAENEQDAWDMVFSGDIDLWTEVVIEERNFTNVQPCVQSDVSPTLRIDQPNEVEIEFQADYPGWIVLSDVWYPGWQARLDSEKVPIYRADFLFRAVKVPSGHHQVQFLYRPFWFYAGAVISLFTWLGFGLTIKSRWWKFFGFSDAPAE
jgi:hypothetical protein